MKISIAQLKEFYNGSFNDGYNTANEENAPYNEDNNLTYPVNGFESLLVRLLSQKEQSIKPQYYRLECSNGLNILD